jgi:hypothetical protein
MAKGMTETDALSNIKNATTQKYGREACVSFYTFFYFVKFDIFYDFLERWTDKENIFYNLCDIVRKMWWK